MPVPLSSLEIFMESGNELRSSNAFKFSSNVSYALEWLSYLDFDGSLNASELDDR